MGTGATRIRSLLRCSKIKVNAEGMHVCTYVHMYICIYVCVRHTPPSKEIIAFFLNIFLTFNRWEMSQ